MAKTPWAARIAREGRDTETRALLLDCAARVFGRIGYARTTIADITQEARVSRAAFYIYFASKSDVFRAVALRVRDAFLAAHELPGVNADDPYELARESSAAFLRACTDNLELMTVIEHQALADPDIRPIWCEIRERPMHRTSRYIERLTAQGIARPAAPADVIAEATYGIFTQFAHHTAANPAGYEETVNHLTAMYLRLLGIPEPSTEAGLRPARP